MLARLRKAKENGEGGFTLIELLVVIIIIGILAAIAIPTFLNQREKGWKAAIKSDISNATIAQESYATDKNGDYVAEAVAGADKAVGLGAEGFNPSVKVKVVATIPGTLASDGFVLVGTHENLDGCTITYTSTTGKSEESTDC